LNAKIKMATSLAPTVQLNLTQTESYTTTLFPETIVSDNLWKYLGIIILVLGTLGHTLSITVMVASKTMRVQSSTIYLIAMSIAGILTLYTGLLRYFIFIGINGWTDDLRNLSHAGCKLHFMLTYASLQYFAWMQATVACDRLISVLSPHTYMLSCKWKIALIVALIELTLVVSLNVAVLVSVGHNDEGYCIPTAIDFWFDVWGYIDLVSFSLLPAFIMIICNSVILVILKKSKMRTSSSSNVARSLTVMLMALNVLFLITTLPISVIFFLNWGTFGERHYAITELCWTIFSLLQYAGSAGTFFVYCFTGSKFREELFALPTTLCGFKSIKVAAQSRKSSAVSNKSRAMLTEPKNTNTCKNYRSLSITDETDA